MQNLQKTSPVDNNVSTIKGILILCIVIEHNHSIAGIFPHLKALLEAFDVFGFFLIVFYFNSREFSFDFMKNRVVRYLVPFLWFYTASSILNHLLIEKIEFSDYIAGLLIMSPPLIKASSGFFYFWFLPCLLTFVLLRSIYVLNSNCKVVVLLITIPFHMFVGLDLVQYLKWIPYNISVTLFCFPVCILFEKLWPYIKKKQLLQFLLLLVWSSLLILVYIYDHQMFLYKNMFSSINDPFWFFVHDICALATIPSLYLISSILKVKLLTIVGKYSLGVFLFHNLIYQLFNRLNLNNNSEMTIFLVLIVTVLISLLLSIIITKIYFLQKLIFPKSSKEMITFLTPSLK